MQEFVFKALANCISLYNSLHNNEKVKHSATMTNNGLESRFTSDEISAACGKVERMGQVRGQKM